MKKGTIILLCCLVLPSVINAKEIEVGFSKTGIALDIILNAINQAKKDIHVAAYKFKSTNISVALIAAKKRGVIVKMLIDKGANTPQSNALKTLKNNQVEICLTDHYAHMHNKFMIIDNNTVQTGSFNYNASAAKRNAENVIVINNKDVANTYQQEFNRLYNECLTG
ncbi:phospholipase D family protein [Arsenophonus nasoniae]|uniref:phospholipase D n=1 Tax=Arsenophonus nasoniae TaxID=638 RepID=A0ABY8NXB4_9GAMM|nr:phospholipase D family protein [Arsenophonus nasoniae]WGM09032.1 phospholipase D family protein [Arsenophonus nasoniae]